MNTKHDLEWLLKANKYIDPDLQNILGFRLSFFFTLLPDVFVHTHALLVGTLMRYSSRMVDKSLRLLLDLGFLEKTSRSLYRKSRPKELPPQGTRPPPRHPAPKLLTLAP